MTSKFIIEETLYTFDDVLIAPAYSEILPSSVDVSSKFTKNISLKTPIVSAAMDTVTESRLAVSMAKLGGIGVVHKNMTPELQVEEIRKVKRHLSAIVNNPVTISPTATLRQALNLMHDEDISGVPVVDSNNKLVGMLTNRDVRFASNLEKKVQDLMTSENLVTVTSGVSADEAKRLLHEHRIEKLIVVDNEYHCVGLITVKDIERAKTHPNASKDSQGRLIVAAAVGAGEKELERAKMLIEAEVDVIVVDTAHGHSKGVIDMVKNLKSQYPQMQIIAGNIATQDAAKALIQAGVDGIKVGIGPGSICTTRIVAGIGVPQLSAIMQVSEVAKKAGVPIIADGGIKYSGDIAKAIAAGADCVMLGSLLAGTEESPGEVVIVQGISYKSYRGMGSLSAMALGSADRYFQEANDSLKLVPEGVEGMVPFKGVVKAVIHQLIGGLKSSMGYTGSADIASMQKNTKFVKISSSSLKESHPHGITITKEAPNYTDN